MGQLGVVRRCAGACSADLLAASGLRAQRGKHHLALCWRGARKNPLKRAYLRNMSDPAGTFDAATSGSTPAAAITADDAQRLRPGLPSRWCSSDWRRPEPPTPPASQTRLCS
jgi:hypothetical protein